jgi:hypothetical protein
MTTAAPDIMRAGRAIGEAELVGADSRRGQRRLAPTEASTGPLLRVHSADGHYPQLAGGAAAGSSSRRRCLWRADDGPQRGQDEQHPYCGPATGAFAGQD